MKTNVAICDDDIDFIGKMEELILGCKDRKYDLKILKFESGENLLQQKVEDMDAIFLDVEMKGMDGNQVSIKLIERGYRGVLVHCSSSMPTPETIKISPYRYLLKQYTREEMMKDLREILDEMVRRKKIYTLDALYLREKIAVHVEDIVYITHHKNGKSILHLKDSMEKIYSEGNILVAYQFKELMDILKVSDFAMPHSSFIVNLHYITKIRKEGFIELDKVNIPISRSQRKEFRKAIKEYYSKV